MVFDHQGTKADGDELARLMFPNLSPALVRSSLARSVYSAMINTALLAVSAIALGAAVIKAARRLICMRVLPNPGPRMQRGSGHEQAQAELCLVEAGQVAVVLGPPPRGEVIAEAAHRPLLGLRPDPRPH